MSLISCASTRATHLVASGLLLLLAACGADTAQVTAIDGLDAAAARVPSTAAPDVTQAATVDVPVLFDATRSLTLSSLGARQVVTFDATFSPDANGLTQANGVIRGTPLEPMVQTIQITARTRTGASATQKLTLVVFGADLTAPTLPTTLLKYSDADVPLPRHYLINPPGGGSVIGADNTPANNAITNAGATLGRVLFYDRRLSENDGVSCASCHQQAFGFGDTAQFSAGYEGGLTGRHAPGLTNARFYDRGRFFWDERAATLEAQVLMPVANEVEMGLPLDEMVTKLAATPFYAALYRAAFGTTEITSDRTARALAQYIRSISSKQSKFDRAFDASGVANFASVFTPEEIAGQTLYTGRAGCARCHGTNGHISDGIHNTGLDAVVTDTGAGNGRFKAPSLRNVAVRGRFMHDGRFNSLEQVIDFYDRGVQNNPQLDPRLRNGPNGQPQRLNLSTAEKASLVAFLRTLTDASLLTDARFSDPFRR